MKKSVSFVLALLAVASMNLSAFALEADSAELTNENVIVETVEETETPALAAGISLGTAIDSETALSGLLLPNQTLRFPILITNEQGVTAALTDADLEGKRIRVETADGRSAVNSIKVVEEDGAYLLEVKTLSGYPTKQVAYSGTLSILNKLTGETVNSLALDFSVGYASVADEEIEAAKDGKYVFIDSTTPVITEKQFDKIDSYLNGDKVVLTNGNWTYEVRVTEQGAVNLLNNEKTIKEIVTQFEDQEFKFLSFPAGPAFDFTGTLTIDVSDVEEQFGGKFHVYSYYNGKLNKVYATYSEEDGTVSFNTKYFGRFVITNEEIPNGTVVVESTDNSTSGGSTAKPNPDTGAGIMGKVAAAMATLSASILALLGIKKKNEQ